MTLLKILLLPFSFLYQCITDVRNYMYDKNYRKSFRFNLPVINVGNLTVGGTGKTPHVEYLLRLLLNKNIKIGTLSRGYGRKTKGFILAD
ncbi:MAG: tetraacyldisaccharide 4'-kinase, partial [Cytophagales bacterium]